MSSLNKFLIVGGVLMVLGPLIGVAGTVVGMVGSVEGMGGAGAANPAALSSEISMKLYSAAIGLAVGLLGALILTIVFFVWLAQRNSTRRDS